jgi:hypothetical protein
MSGDVNNGNSNGPGVPKTTTCLEHIQLLTANINNNKEELFGNADDSKDSGQKVLVGYASRCIVKTATNKNVDRGSGWNVAAPRTRYQKRNVRTTTTSQYMVIKSPNGPGSYSAINCGDYNKIFDPQEHPFRIFTINLGVGNHIHRKVKNG